MTPCGTVGYKAPEIVKDERYSKSVDMWVLGCVLYTLLCGFPPFYNESIQVLTEKVARGQHTFLSPWWDDISKSAQDLVSHLLNVHPDKRYDIKQCLNHPWIRQSNEATHAAADAPLLATPMYQRESGGLGESPSKPDFAYLDETPGKRKRASAARTSSKATRGGNLMNQLNALDEDLDDDDELATEANSANPPAKVPKAGGADVAGMETPDARYQTLFCSTGTAASCATVFGCSAREGVWAS
ncbi:MAPK-activated protein kinase Srk1 [Elasticomyces elasticus]|nr:MAPK-activated protein kinase Srk1 [Elasticomyces elasticus]